MNSNISGGTGEAGVLVRSNENYHRLIDLDTCQPMIDFICQHYQVTEPKLFISSAKRRWGYYKYSGEIIISKPILGVFLHEFAHHIAYTKNGTRGHHNEFKIVLQDLLDLFSI